MENIELSKNKMDIMNYKVAKLKGSYSVEFNCEQKKVTFIFILKD